jgi:prophage regulatory protein
MAKIIRLPQVKERTGLCRTAIYSAIQDGTFPKQIPIGARAVGWDDSEVDTWVDKKIQAAKNGRAST